MWLKSKEINLSSAWYGTLSAVEHMDLKNNLHVILLCHVIAFPNLHINIRSLYKSAS